MGWMSFLDRLLGRARPASFPDELWQRILADTPFLAVLSADEKTRLKALVKEFLAEKRFSAAGDLALTDEICLSIAAQGCLPILNFGLRAYAGWVGVVVYPDEFVVPRVIADDSGVVHEFDDVLSGEAWEGGPLVVSWQDVQLADGGYNVVIHEFAHKIDMLNGEADGIPALHGEITEAQWLRIFDAAYEDFCRQVDLAEAHDEETAIDPYGAESPAEFFAVISETFFGEPSLVADAYPKLYDLLRRYYRQDPLARTS